MQAPLFMDPGIQNTKKAEFLQFVPLASNEHYQHRYEIVRKIFKDADNEWWNKEFPLHPIQDAVFIPVS